MKIIYRILKNIGLKFRLESIEKKEEKRNVLKSSLNSGERNSLLALMYSAENENLFI